MKAARRLAESAVPNELAGEGQDRPDQRHQPQEQEQAHEPPQHRRKTAHGAIEGVRRAPA